VTLINRIIAQEDEFRKAVDRIKTALVAMVERMTDDKTDPNEWLRTLYTAYAGRMLSDNQRIWGTGSIFLPLSITGFAAFIAIDRPQLRHTVVLGLASSSLAWCWLFIAENHRSFQQKSEAWLVAIQETVGIQGVGGPKVRGNPLNRALTFRAAIQWMRWILVIMVTGSWFVLAALCATGRLTTICG